MKTEDPIAKWMTPAPWTLDVKATVEQANELFRTHHIRHLPVTREGHLAGVISERDLFVAATFAQTRGLSLETLMDASPVQVAPQTALGQVASRLFTTREGVAIVMDDGRIVGVFTAIDALRALSEA